MTWWPGWDSIESTGGWAHFWFWFGMICFFLLGASEIVAFRYGLRKDELVAAAEVATAKQRKTDQDTADTRHAAEIGGLKGQLVEADKKVSELQKQQPHRRLTEVQKSAIIEEIKPYPGQKVTISCILGDIYGRELAADFVQVVNAANWKNKGGETGYDQGVYTPQDPVGITILVSEEVERTQVAPPGAVALALILSRLGLIPKNMATVKTGLATDEIEILIGKKAE